MPQTLYLIYVIIVEGAQAVTAYEIAAAVIEIALIATQQVLANQQRQKLKAASQGALDSGRLVMSRDPTASRTIVYGQQRTSGPIAYMLTTGTNAEYLHVVVLLAGHEIDSFVGVYLDGNLVTYDGSGNAIGQYAGYARIKPHTGAPGQAADADLVSDSVSQWTTNATLSGIAYVYVRFKYSVDIYPNGIPNISAVIKGKKVYDPRDGTQSATDPTTWKYSNNSALCLADYLHDPIVGLNVPFSQIDASELTAAANTCDESVPTIAGSEKRYTANVILDTASTPEDNINVLRWSMVGSLIYSGGVFFPQAGAYRTPTLSFNESHVVGSISISPRLSRKDLCNAVSGLRVAPEQDYQAVNFQPYLPYAWLTVSAINTGTDTITSAAHGLSNGTPVLIFATTTFPAPFVNLITYYVVNATTNTLQLAAAPGGAAIDITTTGSGTISLLYEPYLIQDNGERIWLDLQLPATSTDSMAQRIAKINLEIVRQQITVTATFNLSAMQFRAGENIMLSLARMGWSNKVFTVVDWKLTVSNNASAPVPQVEVTLRETASGVWDWNNGEEKTYDLAPDTNLPSPFNPGAPSGLTLTAGSSTAFIQSDGTIIPRLKVSWTTPTDQTVISGGHITIEYKNSLDSNWIQWDQVTGDKTFDYITDVQIGQLYDVRIASENTIGVHSAWISVVNFTVYGDTTAPATPTGLSAAAGTGAVVSLHWTANSESDLDHYLIFRNTSNTMTGATHVADTKGTAFADASVSTLTTYYYFLEAADRSGNVSGATSGVSVTTGGAPATTPGAPGAAGAITLSSQSSYFGSDGLSLALMVLSVPAMPTGAAWQNVLTRVNTSSDWQIEAQLTNTGTETVQLDDMTPGRSYHIGLQAYNSVGIPSAVVEATSSPFTAVADTTAPAVPSGVAATAGTGKSITVAWTPNTETDFEEYQIFRNTTNNSGTATMIARDRGSVFVDVSVSLATTYYYWIKSEDRSDNVSVFSSVASATTVAVPDSSLDQTAPSAPTAATLSASGVYNASDGTTFAYLDISIPALPTGSKVQNLLYKKTGASYWLIASQVASGSTQVARIDDLSPGSSYDVATQAYSFAAVPSTITTATSSPFTAPTKNTGPSACNSPTMIGPTTSGSTIPPLLVGGVVLYAAQAQWLPPSDNDVSYYNVKSVINNLSSSTSYTWTSTVITTKELFCNLYSFSLFHGYTFVQAVNLSGVAGAWTYCGDALSYAHLPIGTVSQYDDTAVNVTGLKIGGSAVSKQTVQIPINTTSISLTGGSSTETKLMTLPSGFLYKPDWGQLTVSSNSNIAATYDWDNTSNSSTVAGINFHALSGTLPSGVIRLTGVFGNNV